MKKLLTWGLLAFLLLFPFYVWAGSQQTSSTLASTIITNARSLVNQDKVSGVTPFCSDAQMLVWLNDGMIDIGSRTKCLEETEIVTLTSGGTEYTLSTPYIEITDVVYVNEDLSRKGLLRGNPTRAGNINDVGVPVEYYDASGKIGVYPTLATVSGTTNECLDVYLVERPATVAAGESVTIPALYDKALTFYIAAQASLRDGQTVKYAALMAIYEKELDRYRIDIVEKPKESDEDIR